MKSLMTVILFSTFSTVASAEVLLERELFNDHNGETYVCRIHKDTTTEIINEGVTIITLKVPVQAKPEKVQGWIDAMKADADFSKVVSAAKKGITTLKAKSITQYVHHGVKQYSLYDAGIKVVYYKLMGHFPKTGSHAKAGSVEYKVATSSQELRGQTDVACKTAISSLR